jgi:uncharacterized protein YneF (UPF0154 family)
MQLGLTVLVVVLAVMIGVGIVGYLIERGESRRERNEVR